MIDLAISDESASTVSVLLNGGNGTFLPAQAYPVGDNTISSPVAIAVADLNHDGKLDIVSCDFVTASGEGAVSIFLGVGDGTFRSAQIFFTLGEFPESLAIGDFNADGKPDLIISNLSMLNGTNAAVAVLLGDGSGKFPTAIETDLSSGFGGRVKIGDFNRDGKLDAAVGNVLGVAVLLGKGDGTFQTPFFADTALPKDVSVGDLNNDGILDIIDMTGGEVNVSLGNGDGTFRTPISTLIGVEGTKSTLTDLNGDGNLDVVISSSSFSCVVLLGLGNGTFQAETLYAVGFNPLGLTSADLNGDGHEDIVVPESVSFVSLLFGNGNGTLQAPLVLPSSPGELAVGDFNNDGKLDVVTPYTPTSAQSTTVLVFLGNGNGTLQLPQSYLVGKSPLAVATSDVNGDGALDLIASASSQVSVLPGNGDGTFGAPQKYALPGTSGNILAADFNQDGKPDLAVLSGIGTNGQLNILLNAGDGTFLPAVSYPFSFSSTLTMADFDEDGHLDLVVSGGSIAGLFLGKGDGTFENPVTFRATGSNVRAADFNRDGHMDFAVAGSGLYYILLGLGNGDFQPPITFLASGIDIDIADLNGDGLPDIAGAGQGFSTLIGLGDGTFTETLYGTGANNVAVGEFNGDNAPDVVLNAGAGLVVLLNTGGTLETLTSSKNPSKLNEPVTFTAVPTPTVNGTSAVPTGTVSFFDGNAMLAKVSLNGGQAKFTTSNLGAGTHTIRANYSGDNHFNPNSARVKQRVRAQMARH